MDLPVELQTAHRALDLAISDFMFYARTLSNAKNPGDYPSIMLQVGREARDAHDKVKRIEAKLIESFTAIQAIAHARLQERINALG